MATRKCPSPIPSCSSLVGPSPTPRPSYPFREVPQLDAVLDRLSQAVVQEGHRLKAWGVLGSGTGAKLLQPGEPQPGPHPTHPTPVHPPTPPPPPKPGPVRSPTPKTPAGEEGRRKAKQVETPKAGRGFLCSVLGKPSALQKRGLQKWEERRRKQTK